MNEPIRFAIVGLGYGRTRLPLVAEAEGAVLSCVVDTDAGKAEEAADQHGVAWTTDFRQLLARDDVDVVCVYTPSGTHRDLVLEAAAAGKHVLTTKPLEISLVRCDEMIEACASAGVELFTEFYLRYLPDNYRAWSAIRGGALGTPILGEFAFKCYRPQWYYDMDGGWRGTFALNGGGIMMNQTIHMVDLLCWFMGEAATVAAVTGTFAHEVEVEDTAAAVLTMRSGAFATLVGTTCHRSDHQYSVPYGGGVLTRAEVSGSLGSLTVVDDLVAESALAEGELPPASAPAANVFADVASALTDPGYSSPTLVRGPDARKPVELVEALYASARSGQRVQLPGGTGGHR